MKTIFQLSLLLIITSQAFADYSPKYLGSFVSSDEAIVDASENGWVILRDLTDINNCYVRANIFTHATLRLCDKGMTTAISINSHGDVLGVSHDRTRALIWRDWDGLSQLERPRGGAGRLYPQELNDRGEAIGYSITITKDEYDDPEYHPHALRWNTSGKLAKILIPRGKESMGLSINNKSEILVAVEGYRNGVDHLLVGKKHLRRIDRKGGDGPIDFYLTQYNYYEYYQNDFFKLTDAGQVAASYGETISVYTPSLGWLVSYNNVCSRCDSRIEMSFSESGNVIYTPIASGDPLIGREGLPLSCTAPMNRVIEGTSIRTADFESFGRSWFLENGDILTQGNLQNDGKSQQLFLFSHDKDNSLGDRDYCVNIDFHRAYFYNHEKTYDYYGSYCQYDDKCDGLITAEFSTQSGKGIGGLPLKLYAYQEKDSDDPSVNCPLQEIGDFVTTAKGFPFVMDLDPGFTYFFRVEESRYSGGGSPDIRVSSSRGVDVIQTGDPSILSPITPCRKPFEGLPRTEVK